jgi:hypothetical protein
VVAGELRGEELAILNPAVTGDGGGWVAQLRRVLKVESTVGRFTMDWRWAASQRGEAVGLNQLEEEEGYCPSWLGRIGQMAGWAKSQG